MACYVNKLQKKKMKEKRKRKGTMKIKMGG
jgi:hypothetical protein